MEGAEGKEREREMDGTKRRREREREKGKWDEIAGWRDLSAASSFN